MTSLKAFVSALIRRTEYAILKPGDLQRLIAEHSVAARHRHDFLLSHPLVKGKPIAELTSVPAVDRPERLDIARRLLKAYKGAAQDEARAPFARTNDDLWTNLVKNELGELLNILAAEDATSLANYLLHFGEKYNWCGGLSFALDGYVDSKTEPQTATTYFDKAICLAEAIGVLPIEHPEHGRWGQNLYTDIDKVLAELESELQISVYPPAGAVFVMGIKTSRGGVSLSPPECDLYRIPHFNPSPKGNGCLRIRRRTWCGGTLRSTNGLQKLHAV